MLNALVNAGSPFEDVPLDASEFEFSNPLISVDPETGAPIQAQPVQAVATVPVVMASSGGSSWIVLLALAAAVAYFWPEIKVEVSKYAG